MANVWTIEEPITIELQPSTLERFHKLYTHELRNVPSMARPDFSAWLEDYVSTKCAKAAEKYADTQQYAALEKYVFQTAKRLNITPQEAAERLKVQLMEK